MRHCCVIAAQWLNIIELLHNYCATIASLPVIPFLIRPHYPSIEVYKKGFWRWQRLRSWAWLPKFCRKFGVLCEGSLSRFAIPSAEPFCRAKKVPQNSGEEWGARTRFLRTGFPLWRGLLKNIFYVFLSQFSPMNVLYLRGGKLIAKRPHLVF